MTRQTTLLRLADFRQKPSPGTVYFDRRELNELLALYSRHVIRGIWRDYAIDHRDGFALFSVFRNSHEGAAYCIMKSAGGNRQSADFEVFAGREKLAAARTLAEALAVFRKKPWLVSARS
ncbi:MAG TPA: DUF2794 domain-containing protein [Stellaceae bacterium]|nr:DUF2794 domain-containing protein [Stellaceae bacterium]